MELVEVVMGPGRTKDKDEAKAASDEMKQLTERVTEIRKVLPKATTSHGWVWCFLQKPAQEGMVEPDSMN